MKICDEMRKLRDILDKYGIPWTDNSDEGLAFRFRVERTKFNWLGINFSVIHGFATYGGWNCEHEDYGLLEIKTQGKDPVGNLTAKQAWDYVKKVVQNG